MTYTLVLAICSFLSGECTPPDIGPYRYQSHYECMHAGYITSIRTIQDIGHNDVNAHKIYIQFYCSEERNL